MDSVGRGLATLGIWGGIGFAIAHIADPKAAMLAAIFLAVAGGVSTVACWYSS